MNWIRLISCVGILAVTGLAGPMGMASLPRLVDQSDLIVVAKVAQGSQNGLQASMTLQVQRVIKGSVASGTIPASMLVSDGFQAQRDLTGLQGIWFLVSDGTKPYRILLPMLGSVPLDFAILPALADLPAAWAPQQSSTPTERLLGELAASLEANRTGTAFFGYFLSQVSEPSSPSLHALYKKMVASSSDLVSTAGLAGLLRSGDVEGLTLLKTALQHGIDAGNGALLAQGLCAYSNGNVQGLSILFGLAAVPSKVSGIAECAALALRAIHSRESLPLLAGLLSASDSSIRYDAVAGLASYANTGSVPNEKPLLIDGVPQTRQSISIPDPEIKANFPTADAFRADEAPYISFWKEWVATNGIQAQALP